MAKEDFKFHAAHFVAFGGYRERLHGHNYRAGVRLLGSRKISADGYVVDFGNIKKVTRKICKEMNEHFLCPMLSDVMDISVADGQVTLSCEDGSWFAFPEVDCAKLPIVHATAEELAIYLWSRIVHDLNAEWLLERGVHTLEITIAEAPSQEATFRLEIPKDGLGDSLLDTRSFIMDGKVRPMPCASAPKEDKTKSGDCDNSCTSCLEKLSTQLQKIADSLNATEGRKFTVKDLEAML